MVVPALILVDLVGAMKFRWWLLILAIISLLAGLGVPFEDGQQHLLAGSAVAFVVGLFVMIPIWAFFKFLSWVLRKILSDGEPLLRDSNGNNYDSYEEPPQRQHRNTRAAPSTTYTVYRRPKGGYDMKVSNFTNPQGAIACGESYKRNYPNDFIRVSSSDGGTIWTS